MKSVPESFGSLVFDDCTMKARLSGEVYHAMKRKDKKPKTAPPIQGDAVSA